MAGWSSYKNAAAMRDAIQAIVVDVINKLIPPPQYAQVASIDEEAQRALVQYSEGGVPVPVRLLSVVPTQPGQVVRIGGRTGDRFVEAVVGSTANIYGLDRIGTLFVWGGVTPPPGSEAADGSGRNVVDYPALFAVLGYKHGGTGDVFNVPSPPSVLTAAIWCVRVR